MGFQCSAPAANQNARHPAKARYPAGKGTLRSPVGGTIYANVIWPGTKWKYAARLRVQINITYYYNNYYTTSLRLPVPLISALKLYTKS